MFIGRYSRGVGKQQALARNKNQTNLQRRFGVAFRTDWYGSTADQFLPVAQHWNEDGWSRRLRDCVGPATVALVDGASVFVFSTIFQEVGTFHLASDTDAFTLGSTGDVVLVSPAIFNVVAPDLEEPIEDHLFPDVGSTSDVSSEIAFYVD